MYADFLPSSNFFVSGRVGSYSIDTKTSGVGLEPREFEQVAHQPGQPLALPDGGLQVVVGDEQPRRHGLAARSEDQHGGGDDAWGYGRVRSATLMVVMWLLASVATALIEALKPIAVTRRAWVILSASRRTPAQVVRVSLPSAQ